MIGEGKQPEGNGQALQVQASMASRAGTCAPKRTLTRAERCVLEVLTDPKLYKKSAKARYEAAGVSKRRYYEIIANPEFMQIQRDFALNLMCEHVAPVLGALVKTASQTGQGGHGDRELYCEMTGLYTPKQQHELNLHAEIIGIVGVQMAAP